MMPELGRFAFAVYLSYGVCAILVGGIVILSIIASEQARRELENGDAKSNGGDVA